MLIKNKNVQSILKGTSYLVIANIITQAIGFLFTIYLANRLSRDNYGIYNTVSAFTNMFVFLSLDGYYKVMLREAAHDPKMMNRLANQIVGWKTMFVLISVVATIVTGSLVNYSVQIKIFIAFYSPYIFAQHLHQIYRTVFQANKNNVVIAISTILQKLLMVLPTILAIELGYGIDSVIYIAVISTFAILIYDIIISKRLFDFKLNIKSIFTFDRDKKYFKPVLTFSFLNVMAYCYSQIDITIISFMMQTKDVATYSVANKFIFPMELIFDMLRFTLLPFLFEKAKKDKVMKTKTLVVASFYIALVTLPLIIGISVFADDIIIYLFKDKYVESIPLLRILVWVIPLGQITMPFGLAMQSFYHEKKLILPNILRALSNIILDVVLIKKFGLVGCVYSTVITYGWYYIFVTIIYQYWVLKKAGNIK